MGTEKVALKSSSGNFFHLFDWNRKSRKKLFSNDKASYVGKIEEKKHSSNPGLYVVAEDDMVVAPRVNEGSDYSCASPKTDEEGNCVRAPSVVARLMGLDSLPTSGVAEPCSTPMHNARFLCDDCRSPESYIKYQSKYTFLKGDVCSSKQMELRSHKMPSSPVERFQTETMPPKLTKSVPFSHHKLFSPIKSSGFISPKNASHIIEAATKIFEPDNLNGDRARSQPFRLSLNPSRILDPRENISAHKRTQRSPDSSTGTKDTLEPLRGQTSTSNSNGLENSMLDQTFPRTKGSKSSVQAKLNSQRGNQLSRKSGGSQLLKNSEVANLNMPSKRQPNIQKNNQIRSASSANTSSVLRQNNQKQNNLPSKSKIPSKLPVSNRHGRKVISVDTSGAKKTVDNAPGNVKSCYLNEDPEASSHEMEGLLSSSKHLSRNKRVEQRTYSQRSGSIDDMHHSGQGKLVRHNVVMNNHAQWKDGIRNGTDVVSFTFTSPMRKSVVTLESDDKNSTIVGDSLGILIERKLRELASRTASPLFESVRGVSVVSALDVDDSTSSGVPSINYEYNAEPSLRPDKELCGSSGSNNSFNGNQLSSERHNMLDYYVMENFTSTLISKESGHQGQSPILYFQHSHADDDLYSSQRWKNDYGSNLESSSFTSEEIASWDTANKMLTGCEVDLSDTVSASSTYTNDVFSAVINQDSDHDSCRQEVEYVKVILSNMGIIFEDMICLPTEYFSGVLNPLIFDKLEENRGVNAIQGEEKELRLKRKMLFDSVNECLDRKCSLYFQAGYLIWAKGIAVVGKELAEELYKEILGWKSIGDWLVDELVDKDMSTHLGRWTNFEIEAFEAGVDVEKMVLNTLIEEVVADFL